MRAGLYARVSTLDQHPENQLEELRRYVAARGWEAVEYVDKGISGAKEARPGLNQLLSAAKKRKVDIVICWRLDRLGRSLRHLILMLDELAALGVGFVSLNEGIDTSTLQAGCSSMSSAPSPNSSAPESLNVSAVDSPAPDERVSGSGDCHAGSRFASWRRWLDCPLAQRLGNCGSQPLRFIEHGRLPPPSPERRSYTRKAYDPATRTSRL